MSNKDVDIDSIVEELLRLQIRQMQLLQYLHNTGPRETKQSPVPPITPSNRSGSGGPTGSGGRTCNRPPPTLWSIGDCVRIANRIHQHPATENDRLARITDITEDEQHDDTRVSIETLNGQPTWRLRKNLWWISAREDEH